MKKLIKLISIFIITSFIFTFALTVTAAEPVEKETEESVSVNAAVSESSTANIKAIAAAAMIALVATGGAIAMAIAISRGSDGIAKQPEAASNIRTNVMLGLVFIETAIIYALIVAILIIFVL